MKRNLLVVSAIVGVALVIGCMGSGGGLSNGSTGNTSTNGSTSTTGGGGTTVDVTMTESMTFCCPQVITAHAGDTVKWTNVSTTLPHTVISDSGEPGLDSSTLFPAGIPIGGTFSWTVPIDATIGKTYYYHCGFHGFQGNGTSLGFGMAGGITVN